ncbi:MAG: ATP-dependent 6-phosphofructokinase [Acidobacteria bacterium]|nr:ATP-dependent 6-phosphofructokinase [Acidobacteriota bacterium]
MAIKRVGVLTGGGDAPGLNAAIKGLVTRCNELNIEVMGLHDGWQALLDPHWEEATPLDHTMVRRWDRDGGTNLGSSRTNPFKAAPVGGGEPVDRSDEAVRNAGRLKLDAVVAMGGEDTLGVASKLSRKGLPVLGVPKTIDNDLPGTDYTLGFDTALQNCLESIERARTPAGSHHMVMVVEIMGRHAGHLAFWSGVAGGADMILIPEHPFSYQLVYQLLEERLGGNPRDRKRPRYALIAVAEGATAVDESVVTADVPVDAFGHVRLGGIGNLLSEKIHTETRFESRAVVLGHAQRGGSPGAIDRIMGRMFGVVAADALGRGEVGKMVSARGVAPACTLSLVDISAASGPIRLVDVKNVYDPERYVAKI